MSIDRDCSRRRTRSGVGSFFSFSTLGNEELLDARYFCLDLARTLCLGFTLFVQYLLPSRAPARASLRLLLRTSYFMVRHALRHHERRRDCRASVVRRCLWPPSTCSSSSRARSNRWHRSTYSTWCASHIYGKQYEIIISIMRLL